MISITCTSCQNVLSIDDAFAGGVCRCQHCGTIQTVPARRKETGAKATVKASEGKSPKALYTNESRTAVAAGSGSGLDDLAGIVASSGLSDGQLRKRTETAKPGWKKSLLLIIAGGLIALVVLAVVYLLMRPKLNRGSAAGPAGAGTSNAFAPSGPGEVIGDADNPSPTGRSAAGGPNCFGIKLSQESVVYLIDNGSSATPTLDYVKAAVFRSVESLGSKHYFQILFWNPETPTYPTTSDLAAVMPVNIEDARRVLQDTESGASTDPGESLKKALAVLGQSSGEIVLITAKGYTIDDSVLQTVMKIRGTSTVKIHTVAINGAPEGGILRKIAEQTGGTFTSVSAEQLKTAAD